MRRRFRRGGAARGIVENESSHEPMDEGIVSIGRNEGKATKTNVPAAHAPIRRPSETQEATDSIEHPNDVLGPPTRAPEASEPSPALQPFPASPTRRLPAENTSGRDTDASRGVRNAKTRPPHPQRRTTTSKRPRTRLSGSTPPHQCAHAHLPSTMTGLGAR